MASKLILALCLVGARAANQCEDSASWTKKGDESKDCEWVAAYPEKRCNVRGPGGKTDEARYSCLVACGSVTTISDFAEAISQMSWMAAPERVSAEAIDAAQPVGTHTAHICEATDALYCDEGYPDCVADGMSGDTNYPHGDIKVLATVGEVNPVTGHMLVGVPDGMGAYLLDDHTIRFVYQSESYGSLNWWCREVGCGDSYPFIVNEESGATFTGSHIVYIDYDRKLLADFMSHGESAAAMVKGSGNLVAEAYNLKGDLIEPRNKEGDCCSPAPHFSITDADGCGCWSEIMNGDSSSGRLEAKEPERADWVMMSLCSAHLEEKHQWGEGIGVEADLFITNEEWTYYRENAPYTGLPAHVVDLATMKMYATGVFTLGGFEKIVEVNCGHPDYVCFSPSGYNGNLGVSDASRRNEIVGKRPDGTDYVFPKYVVPNRIYVGKKGYNAAGEPADDFLSKNGLAYGQVYGFATDIEETTGGLFMDAFHKEANGHMPGETVAGAFEKIDWMWDGEVKDFIHDGSWAFQHDAPSGNKFWNSAGYDAAGCKTEHNSPDPYGGNRFAQSSTCGYIGVYDFSGVADILAEAAGGFPESIPATYTMAEGERDITAQIELGGKGKKANGMDQTTMSDSYSVADDGTVSDSAKPTFEDIDSFEWIAAKGATDGYFIIQEDGSNDFGERNFIAEVKLDGTLMTYYFIAQSGGDDNTRNKALVGVPAGTNVGYWDASSAHEFSGIVDFSGMLAMEGDTFACSAGDGACKRAWEAEVAINDKMIVFGLQAHSLTGGILQDFHGDRGGQVYAYQPALP